MPCRRPVASTIEPTLSRGPRATQRWWWPHRSGTPQLPCLGANGAASTANAIPTNRSATPQPAVPTQTAAGAAPPGPPTKPTARLGSTSSRHSATLPYAMPANHGHTARTPSPTSGSAPPSVAKPGPRPPIRPRNAGGRRAPAADHRTRQPPFPAYGPDDLRARPRWHRSAPTKPIARPESRSAAARRRRAAGTIPLQPGPRRRFAACRPPVVRSNRPPKLPRQDQSPHARPSD